MHGTIIFFAIIISKIYNDIQIKRPHQILSQHRHDASIHDLYMAMAYETIFLPSNYQFL